MPRRPAAQLHQPTQINALFTGAPMPERARRMQYQPFPPFPRSEEIESRLDEHLAAAWRQREGMMQAEASQAADRYVEQRAKDAARASKQEYVANSAVPARVKNVFEACDFDRNGFLDYRELRTALRMYGIDVSAHAAASVLAAYDADPDGKLDLVEFHGLVKDAEQGSVSADPSGVGRSAHAAAALGVTRRVRDTFDRFDYDGDGYLDYRELRNALHFMGIDASTRGAVSVLAAYDDRPDGRLDLGEFARLVRDAESGGVLADFGAADAMASRAGGSLAVPAKVRAAFDLFDRDGSGRLDYKELRDALHAYGIDASHRGAAEVLTAYDDHPDGQLDLAEFARLVSDAERGFVLSAAEASAAAGRTVPSAFVSRPPLSGLGSAANGGARSIHYGGRPSTAAASWGAPAAQSEKWPHHRREEARLEAVREELMRDGGYGSVREKLLLKDAFWRDRNGEWVRRQLIAEQESRRDAEQEAKIAKAEAAAAIARVEALRAAAAARELEIEAAAARLVHKEHQAVRDDAASRGGAGAGGAGAAPRPSNAAEASKERVRKLVQRLEVALLEKLDERASTDAESARANVLRRVFRSAPIGGPRSATYATRAEFHDGLALLGLPQSATSVQVQKQEPESAGLPGAPPEVKPSRQQAVVDGDAAINRAVVDALFDKYAEKPPVKLLTEQARFERAAADREKVVDYVSLYGRINRAAVRPGAYRAPSLEKAQAEFMSNLKGQRGSIFDAQRAAQTQGMWAQARAQHGETRRVTRQPSPGAAGRGSSRQSERF